MLLISTLVSEGLGVYLPGGDLTTEDKQAFLDRHNDLRSLTALGLTGEGNQPPAKNMQKMVWNEDLAAGAKVHADKCNFAHDSGFFGENLYAAASSSDTLDDISQLLSSVDSWFDEQSDYSYSGGCSPGKVCGHYTQVVWDNSNELGCAYNLCENSIFGWPYEVIVVCRYLAPGNFIGQKPYEKADNESEIASECPDGTVGESSTGLCVVPQDDDVPQPCNSDQVLLTIDLTVDDQGSSENKFYVAHKSLSATNWIVAYSKESFQDNQHLFLQVCVPASNCYAFATVDTGGDGLTDGGYTFSVGNEIVSGGDASDFEDDWSYEVLNCE